MANEDKKDFNAMLHDSTEKSKRLQIFTYYFKLAPIPRKGV